MGVKGRRDFLFLFSVLAEVLGKKNFKQNLIWQYSVCGAIPGKQQWSKKEEQMQDVALPSWLELCRKPDGCSIPWAIYREIALDCCLFIIEKEEGALASLLFVFSQSPSRGPQQPPRFGLCYPALRDCWGGQSLGGSSPSSAQT